MRLKVLPGVLRAGRSLLKGLAWRSELRSVGVQMVHGVSQPMVEGSSRAEAVCYNQGGLQHRLEAGLVLLHNGVGSEHAAQLRCGVASRHGMRANTAGGPLTDDWGATNHARIAVAGDGAGILGARAAANLGRLAALDTADDWASSIWRGAIAWPLKIAWIGAAARVARGVDKLFPPAADLLAPVGATTSSVAVRRSRLHELQDAVAQGLHDANRVKAFTRCGMGPCQGRMCGAAAAEVIARALGQTADQPAVPGAPAGASGAGGRAGQVAELTCGSLQ